MNAVTQWPLDSAEPWTRYRTLRDLLGRPKDDAEVVAARAVLLAHPQVQSLIAQAATWPGRPILRHHDASHPIYALSTLADFGLTAADPGLDRAAAAVLDHRLADGALQSVLTVAPAFGGTGGGTSGVGPSCDAPTLLYALWALGLGAEPTVQAAVEHLVNAADEVDWRRRCGPELGKFRGPGRKADPCPIANVCALKGQSRVPELRDSPATRRGAERPMTCGAIGSAAPRPSSTCSGSRATSASSSIPSSGMTSCTWPMCSTVSHCLSRSVGESRPTSRSCALLWPAGLRFSAAASSAARR